MPYITKNKRQVILKMVMNGQLFDQVDTLNVGELNFLLSAIINRYTLDISYNAINDVMGVLEGVKSEYYRRVVAPYEDKKKAENGDVYYVDAD